MAQQTKYQQVTFNTGWSDKLSILHTQRLGTKISCFHCLVSMLLQCFCIGSYSGHLTKTKIYICVGGYVHLREKVAVIPLYMAATQSNDGLLSSHSPHYILITSSTIHLIYTFLVRFLLKLQDATKTTKKERACPGFEPGTSCSQSKNHTPRPTGLFRFFFR